MNVLSDYFKINKVYRCLVAKINPTYLILSVSGVNGICHISEVSDYKVNNLNDFFKEGNEYDFILIKLDEENNLYNFSYKRINPKLLKHHNKIIPTTSGFEKLYNNTLDKLYKEDK